MYTVANDSYRIGDEIAVRRQYPAGKLRFTVGNLQNHIIKSGPRSAIPTFMHTEFPR